MQTFKLEFLGSICRLQAVCVGCSGTVEHIDWSYALVHGPMAMHGRYILQSNDTSREVIHWDGLTGKKISGNQRDCLWSTWTCTLGFPVLGIWPDYSDGSPPYVYNCSFLFGLSDVVILPRMCIRFAHVDALSSRQLLSREMCTC
jgi:hypothetical protein